MATKSWMNVVMRAALITGCVAVYVFVESGTRDQLSRLEDKIDRVETKLEDKIDRVETKISRVETKISRVETKLEDKIDRVEIKLEDKIDRVETKIDRVETKIDEISGYFKYESDVKTGVCNMFCVTGNSMYLVHKEELLWPETERIPVRSTVFSMSLWKTGWTPRTSSAKTACSSA